MISAAEGRELLGIVEDPRTRTAVALYARLHELAQRIAHDAEVGELSRHLESLCAQLEPGSDFPDPVLLQEIRNVAERLGDGTVSFVIWTRYERPDGKVVRHAFGPYPTRSKAQTALKNMLRENEGYGLDLGRVEAHVTKMIGDQK